MDRRERGPDLHTALLAAFEGQQSGLWTAMPGYAQGAVDGRQTISVQPALRARVQAADGSFSWINLPLLVDCPVFWPGGGGCTLTFPVGAGDEGLLVFASRCIDSWWQLGGIQNQADIRMHDLSDGFFLPGFNSLPHVLPSVHATETQLRSDDGLAVIGINPTSHAVHVNTPGNAAVTAARIDLNGVLYINGIAFNAHQHSGVASGANNTGGVV